MSKLQTTAIEVNLTEHCNLKCRVCSHASHLLPEKFTPLQVFENDLRALSKVMAVEEREKQNVQELENKNWIDEVLSNEYFKEKEVNRPPTF